ncbi:MAG: heparan-alpha-glucosaminide N-acetyltransferase [Candidatus Peregrinibacteria bacterium]|nr:heparan-alpha-glucosaminide N-acetyltransferase [Candidatus Peregrinibacteria bacterium]
MPLRRLEIDLLRTLAIAMMVVYHLAFDLVTFHGWEIDVFTGGWRLFARATATLFLLLVGVSFVLSYQRADHPPPYRKYAKRALIILGAAYVVSLATFVVDPETYVRFGILHLIGTVTFVLPILAPLREGNILIGSAIIVLSPLLKRTANTALLIPLGITPPWFQSVDYFPLFPWAGVILMGVGIGYAVYVRMGLRHSSWEGTPLLWSISTPGRYALLLYLLHQPVLFSILAIIF